MKKLSYEKFLDKAKLGDSVQSEWRYADYKRSANPMIMGKTTQWYVCPFCMVEVKINDKKCTCGADLVWDGVKKI